VAPRTPGEWPYHLPRRDFRHISDHFRLTEAMVQRKHSDANIRLLLGGSFSRVLGPVWK
jgi:hypothetical protein